MTRPDPLTPTVALDQPSETEPAIRLRRYSADTTGDILEVTDEAGTVIQGIKADGTIRNANGGSVPITRQQIQGNDVTVADGNTAALTFDTPSGDSLLDITVPATPTVIATGTYAVTVTVAQSDGMTAGGWWSLVMDLDAANESPEAHQDVFPVPAVGTEASVAMTYYMLAGATIKVFAQNHDGAATRTFNIVGAVIQRIS